MNPSPATIKILQNNINAAIARKQSAREAIAECDVMISVFNSLMIGEALPDQLEAEAQRVLNAQIPREVQHRSLKK